MIIEITRAGPGEDFARVVVDGYEQKVSAIHLELRAGRESMTVWDRESGEREAQAFLAAQP
jgi:hypothetical protein